MTAGSWPRARRASAVTGPMAASLTCGDRRKSCGNRAKKFSTVEDEVNVVQVTRLDRIASRAAAGRAAAMPL